MKHLFCPILLLFLLNSHAQDSSNEYYLAFGKESFFYPSKEIIGSPLHPTLLIGFQKNLKTKRKSDRSITAEAGIYHHDYFENGFFVLAGYQFTYFTNYKFSLSWKPELGYHHSWSPTGTFRLENGTYKRTSNLGRPNVMFAMNAVFDYQVFQKGETRLFFQFKTAGSGPFAIPWGVPVAPYTFLMFGIKSNLQFK